MVSESSQNISLIRPRTIFGSQKILKNHKIYGLRVITHSPVFCVMLMCKAQVGSYK